MVKKIFGRFSFRFLFLQCTKIYFIFFFIRIRFNILSNTERERERDIDTCCRKQYVIRYGYRILIVVVRIFSCSISFERTFPYTIITASWNDRKLVVRWCTNRLAHKHTHIYPNNTVHYTLSISIYASMYKFDRNTLLCSHSPHSGSHPNRPPTHTESCT